jgi:dATP pyrophosphohydrolase
VTGSLDAGEVSFDAARRELAEETGLTDEGVLLDRKVSRCFTIDPRWRDRYAANVTENVEHEWHYRLARPTDIRIDDQEHSEFCWVSIDEAVDAVWSWTNKDALRALKIELRQKTQTV